MKSTLLLLCVVSLLWYGCAGDPKNNMKAAASKQDWQTVRELAEKHLRVVPTDNDATVLLALALFYTERNNPDSIERAIRYMRQVLTSETQRYDLHFIYGWILLNTGHYQESRIPLKAAYELHLKEPHTMGQDYQGMVKYALGRSCMLNSLYGEALKYYEQASKSLELNDWVTLYNDMACCYACLGDYVGAMNYLNLAMAKEKHNIEVSEKEREKKKDAIPYENPYAYLLTVNTAVVCDYLSYPSYNSGNYTDYAAVRADWYNNAANALAVVAQSSLNASQQQRLYDLIKQINQRKAAILASK